MRRQAYKFFPTLVHYCKDVLTPAELQQVAEHCLHEQVGRHDALSGDSRSSFSRHSRLIETLEARHASLAGLRDRLESLLTAYAADMGFDGVRHTNSWFNIQQPGSVLKHHVHTDAKIAAALYICCDEHSSKLFLENPNPTLNYIRPNRFTEYSFEFATFKVAPGDLVLFPAWIRHGSGFEANQSALRLVVSMNGE